MPSSWHAAATSDQKRHRNEQRRASAAASRLPQLAFEVGHCRYLSIASHALGPTTRARRRRRVPSPIPSAPPRRAGRARAAGPTTARCRCRGARARPRIARRSTASFDSGRRARFRLRCHARSAHAGPRPASAQSMHDQSGRRAPQPRLAILTSPCSSVGGVVAERAHERSRIGVEARRRRRPTRARASVNRCQPSPIDRRNRAVVATRRFEVAQLREEEQVSVRGREEPDVVAPVPPRRRARRPGDRRTSRAAASVMAVVAVGEELRADVAHRASTPSRPSRADGDDRVVDRGRGVARTHRVPTTRARAVRSRPMIRISQSPPACRCLATYRHAVDRHAVRSRAPDLPGVVSGSRALAVARRSSIAPIGHGRPLSRRVPAILDWRAPASIAVLPPAHDRRLARGPEQGAVFGPQVHEAVPEPVGDRVHTDVGEHPRRSARGARPAGCCRGCCRRPAGRAPGRCPTARSRR